MWMMVEEVICSSLEEEDVSEVLFLAEDETSDISGFYGHVPTQLLQV